MATRQVFVVCDNSTVANFKSWAQSISTSFSTFGWSQTSDTGQVNWSTISTAPGTGAYVYEIWQPNDGISPNFYLKMEYGNFSGSANSPSVRLTIGTSTDGAGNINSGFILGPLLPTMSTITAPSTTATYECDFSGGSGRFGAMLWRNGPTGNQVQTFFAIERSVNSSGAYTGTYVTIYVAGFAGNVYPNAFSQSYVFGVGSAPMTARGYAFGTGFQGECGFMVRVVAVGSSGSGSTAFNGSIPFDTAAPYIGYIDLPGTVAGCAWAPDIVEAVQFQVSLYGATRTYLPSKIGYFSWVGPACITSSNNAYALCMRYD